MSNDFAKTLELPVGSTASEARGPVSEPDPTVRLSESMLESLPGVTTEKAISVPTTTESDRATLTVLTAINAGQVFSIEGDAVTLGRDKEAEITLDDPSISRRHAEVRRVGEHVFAVLDLGSTNGTYVGARRVDGPTTLASGDRVQLGPNVILRFTMTDEAEASLQRRLYESSTRDALTDAFNRKYFNERLASEIAYARRHKTQLAVLILDVDHFKRVNDTFGHLTGDRMLRSLAAHLARTIRLEDVLARYGGEEFAVIARSASAVDATRLAERLRAAVERLTVPMEHGEHAAPLTATVSIGVANLPECPNDVNGLELIGLADRRLYAAKRAGRNRVHIAD